MRASILILLVALLAGTPFAFAEDGHEADRKALLDILASVEKGINEENIDLLSGLFAPQAVVTWLNAEVSQGPDGVRDYFKRMVGNGEGAILKKYATHPKITQPAVFYGDVAIAAGSTEDEFTPHHRGVFNFSSRWTASLKKTDGQWKIIALNLSTNTFDNVLVTELKRFAVMTGIAGAVGGGILVAAIGFLRRRKAKA